MDDIFLIAIQYRVKGSGLMESSFLLGIDIGSTTTKIVLIDQQTEEKKYTIYRRHNAAQLKSVYNILNELKEKGYDQLSIVLTGSGAKPIAQLLSVPYIQEVVANSIALKKQYQSVKTAIELGGQDAKIIFFSQDGNDNLKVNEMRMNGSCAGGTGAFIDEIASLLKVPIEDFDQLANQGDSVYDISGRCGVYAKTDIQPLLNQGISKENLALSAFHAIAKQTIGGLAQGLDIEKPVAFEGGPLTFNPTLIDVFAQRLNLKDEDILVPEQPETMIAYGAALSLNSMFKDSKQVISIQELLELIENQLRHNTVEKSQSGPLYFENEEEKQAFMIRHQKLTKDFYRPQKGDVIHAYLGIDSGSTTTKFVLMDENDRLIDTFYASNEGEPLKIAKKALIDLRDKYQNNGALLDIVAVGTTGYGEQLFAKAFNAEYHVVETVAHAKAANFYEKDVSFILDIGGQDMKAIWLDHGIVTNIVVNEACSSGCGSFLENFAKNLNISVEDIEKVAFQSKNPAILGSRCTVFMNSSIVTEQRNGKTAEDIMAGLCRSIIENVFTKVIRIANLDSLGNKIVVQGGTFENDAVLRAMEQYIGKEVIRASYPGIMGAIGVALLTKEYMQKKDVQKSFIGLDALDSFSYKQESNTPCPFCANHCKRTILTFSNGQSWITNNRCEKGEIIGNPKDKDVLQKLKEKLKNEKAVPNLFDLREKLLFKDYEYGQPKIHRSISIGLPKVLSYWDNMPFWKTFFKALGFDVIISDTSTRKIYESGLSSVSSDTVCFPAKLVHGHIRNLVEKKVDRIFMPIISNVPTENTEKTSESMCAVVKGYPLVIQNSDNPQKRFGVIYDAPMFYWYSVDDRNKQIEKYMVETFGLKKEDIQKAIQYADQAQNSFHQQMKKAGQKVIDEVEKNGKYAVVLASRPYQNDPLVNHELPTMLTRLGIPVLTVDSIPGSEDVDLSLSRLDIVNNYHARMLSSAIIAAQSTHLEYVQIVSFGCGHDAYLSDEIIRLMKEISHKTPLVLKLDESDIQGPLRIRVRSFIETVNMKHSMNTELKINALTDPYPQKFDKQSVKDKTVLVPNTSHAFCRIMSAALSSQHIKAVPLEIGREKAIYLGKKYVHNDICFPAQIVIGEALAELESGKYDIHQVAIGMGKYIGDCRLTHYSALLRKALDDAGYKDVPIITNDDVDYHHLHPAFKMNLSSSLRIAFALPMIDILEELLRKIRPYELVEGSTQKAFDEGMDALIEGLEKKGIHGAKKGFKVAIDKMNQVAYDRSQLRPRVLIVGEYLLNFHPGANHDIEDYLEKNGFEIIEARMTDVIRKTYFYQDTRIREYHLNKTFKEKSWLYIADHFFDLAHQLADSIAKQHPLYEPVCRLSDLAKESDSIIHHTFDAGEGILIPGEILHHAKNGCKNFIILQPFGCLPNHIVGRGIVKRLKEIYPDVQILPLDYDPDVSFANIENRLQMLIMNAKGNEYSVCDTLSSRHGQ